MDGATEFPRNRTGKFGATRRRVGYKPKGMSPELAEDGQTVTVGFILRSGLKLYSQSPFFGHVQHGLHEALVAHGVSLVYLGTEDHLDVKKLKELYGDRKVFRGLVVFGEVKRPFLHALKQLEPRVVSVSAQYPGLCHSVVYNEEQAAEMIVQHLADLGHREFAWLGGSRGMQRPLRRLEATMSALRLRNLTINPKFIVEVDDADRLEGRQAAELMLKAAGRRHRPTAWICYNGTMARGARELPPSTGLENSRGHQRGDLRPHPPVRGGASHPDGSQRGAGGTRTRSRRGSAEEQRGNTGDVFRHGAGL